MLASLLRASIYQFVVASCSLFLRTRLFRLWSFLSIFIKTDYIINKFIVINKSSWLMYRLCLRCFLNLRFYSLFWLRLHNRFNWCFAYRFCWSFLWFLFLFFYWRNFNMNFFFLLDLLTVKSFRNSFDPLSLRPRL